MQHLVNTFTPFATKSFVSVDGFKFKTRHFNRQSAKVAIFFDFIRHDTNPFLFGKYRHSVVELYLNLTTGLTKTNGVMRVTATWT